MKSTFLALALTSALCAEEASEPHLIYFEMGPISAPLSFYTENWDPKQQLPPKLPGVKIEEKDLVVNLDEAIKKSREEQDLLRSQNSWLSDTAPYDE